MMDIPDEARTAALRAMDIHPAEASRALGDALEAAAPHIARAAQIEVLRELAVELNGAGNRRPANEAEGWHYASDYVANKADELEAGA